MMSHIDYDIDYDGSSSMEDMELYSDNSFPCMDEETLMDYEEFISRMESENCYTMTSKTSFNKLEESQRTLYGETSSTHATLHQAQEGATSTRATMHMILIDKNITWLHKGVANNKNSSA